MYLNIRQFANLQPKIVKDDYIQIFEKKTWKQRASYASMQLRGMICVAHVWESRADW